MAPEIPTTEPTQFTAGDSLAWDREDLTDYPASGGWSLSYALAGPQKIAINATADGDHYHVRVDAIITRTWVAGQYWWEAYVTKTTERYRVAWGTIVILPNLQDAAAGYDGRSVAEKALEAWKELFFQLSEKKASTVSHGGKTYTEKDIPAVITAMEKAQALVNAEKARDLKAQGKKTGRKILMKFKAA